MQALSEFSSQPPPKRLRLRRPRPELRKSKRHKGLAARARSRGALTGALLISAERHSLQLLAAGCTLSPIWLDLKNDAVGQDPVRRGLDAPIPQGGATIARAGNSAPCMVTVRAEIAFFAEPVATDLQSPRRLITLGLHPPKKLARAWPAIPPTSLLHRAIPLGKVL
jgi:hypothetical protein